MNAEPVVKIFSSNLASALLLAITTRERWEKGQGYFSDSSLLDGWKKALESLERNEPLEIINQ